MWEEYVEELKQRFGPTYEAPMENLMKLQQTSSLEEFDDEFDAIAFKIRLSEEYLIQTYTAGLEEEFAAQVRMFKLRTLREARNIARTHKVNCQKAQTKMRGIDSRQHLLTSRSSCYFITFFLDSNPFWFNCICFYCPN